MCDIHEEDAVFRAINGGWIEEWDWIFIQIYTTASCSYLSCSFHIEHVHKKRVPIVIPKKRDPYQPSKAEEGDEKVLHKETIRMSMDKFT